MNYPIILHPANRPIHQFSISMDDKNKRKGASEMVVFSRILKLGLECIREDMSVLIDGHRYEPDFAYVNEEKGIFIDIEIDEPYSSVQHPTHYITKQGVHKDAKRNEAFCNAGWYVMRFTEQQMFCNTASCMKIIFEILYSLGVTESMSYSLLNASTIEAMPAWTYDKAKEYSVNKFRKSYLGYNPINMDFSSYLRCCLLVIPILFQSMKNNRLRQVLCKQLNSFFLKSHK